MDWPYAPTRLPRPGTPDAEVEVLLLQLRQAHTLLDRVAAADDRSAVVHGMEQALETHNSVKNILTKLGLAPAQLAAVQQELRQLQIRLMKG